jgi:hypothetical protein
MIKMEFISMTTKKAYGAISEFMIIIKTLLKFYKLFLI